MKHVYCDPFSVSTRLHGLPEAFWDKCMEARNEACEAEASGLLFLGAFAATRRFQQEMTSYKYMFYNISMTCHCKLINERLLAMA